MHDKVIRLRQPAEKTSPAGGIFLQRGPGNIRAIPRPSLAEEWVARRRYQSTEWTRWDGMPPVGDGEGGGQKQGTEED